MGAQVAAQAKAVLITVLWSGIGSAVLIFVTKSVTVIRVSREDERQGLDLTAHGECAYHG
jgi:Amt family ammonium transporter